MNIGIDARLWQESGVGRYIRNLVRGIEEKDLSHTFTVFLTTQDFEKINFKTGNIKKVKANSRWHTLSEQWEFKKIIEQENLDLVHFPYFSYPVFYKKPFVITIHDLIIDHFPTGMASSLPLPFYYLKHYAYKKIIENGIKNSARIIVPSDATKKELIDHYNAENTKIQTIYEGFDPSISKGKSHTPLVSKKYILSVGNAYPHKNLPLLLEAYSYLRKEIIDIDLVCIGRKDFFYERIEKGKHEGVHFLHTVDDGQLFEYYRNAQLFVMPSLMEGFGLPVLEAMSLSCPVICSDTPALKEIGKDAVIYFDSKDAVDLVQKMQSVLGDRKIQQDLVEKGRKRSHDFSWDRCIEETIKVYESSNSV